VFPGRSGLYFSSASLSKGVGQMKDRLLAYLLDDLNATERTALEVALASDPELQQELEKLRECLGCCETEAEPEPPQVPPPQLASRTCHFVEHAIKKSQALCPHSSHAKSLSENHDPLVAPKRWSFADIAVGLGVLAALGALTFPAIHDNRDAARRLTCQNNMHQVGAALMDYSLRFNRGLPRIEQGENAGIFVVVLADSGVVAREKLAELMVCPSTQLAERVSNNCIVIEIPTRKQFMNAKGAERERYARYMAGDFAYSMGYQDKTGAVHQVHFSSSPYVPLLADAPSSSIAGYQSANHGGCGQNVLFQDLSCRYTTQCKCQEKRDHWFLNDEGQVAAGRHAADIVLGASAATPVSKIPPK
jgi:hypothetical protein